MFSQEVADRICSRLMEGEKGLRQVCVDEGVKHSTIILWLKDNPAFADQYARSREIGYTIMADDLMDIANQPLEGVETTKKANGDIEEKRGDMLGHRRLMVDTRKWMLSKMLPKVYGDKLDLNHSGRIQTSREMTEEELASIAAGSGS